MHRLLTVSKNIMTDITPLVGSITWKSSIGSLGEQLDFDIAFNDDRYFPQNPVDLGSLVILSNKEEITRGIVLSEDRNGRSPIKYTCFDYAFYLNKSKGVYQFNRVKASQAIESLLKDINIPIGEIAPINTPISKIYTDKVVAEIIKDILETSEKETGIKYQMEMRKGKLHIEPQQNLVIQAQFQLAENIAPNQGTEAISNPSRKRSIEDMKNSIQIISDKKVVAEVKNQELIDRYGLLQEVQSIDQKDRAQAKNIAENLLKDLGKIFEENSLELLGDDKVRAGRILEVTEETTGMKGQYLVSNVTHTVKNGIHKMNLGLEVM